MARKKTAAVAAAPAVKTHDIGELCRQHQVPAWERSAMLKVFGWMAGKRVTLDEFLAARDEVQHRRM